MSVEIFLTVGLLSQHLEEYLAHRRSSTQICWMKKGHVSQPPFAASNGTCKNKQSAITNDQGPWLCCQCLSPIVFTAQPYCRIWSKILGYVASKPGSLALVGNYESHPASFHKKISFLLKPVAVHDTGMNQEMEVLQRRASKKGPRRSTVQ